jgi:hypothetical protein
MLDIDPHEGSREFNFYLWLRENKYNGIVVCDDIIHFQEMRTNFWDKVDSQNKLDISRFGHWSGTGLIYFNPSSVPSFLKSS